MGSRRRSRRLLAAGAIAIVLTAGSVTVSEAHKVTFKSIVEINGYQTVGAFIGSVGSFENPKCGRARVVTVWRRNPGAMDGPMGTTRTNRGGGWRLEVLAPAGNYYATVKRSVIRRKHGHRHVCAFDKSSNFKVG